MRFRYGNTRANPSAHSHVLYMRTASLPVPKQAKTTSPSAMRIQRSKATAPAVGTMTMSYHVEGSWISAHEYACCGNMAFV